MNFPDGTSEEVADRDAAKEAALAWKEANPDATERPAIAFPYNVELADGTIMPVGSEEELEALKNACEDNEAGN